MVRPSIVWGLQLPHSPFGPSLPFPYVLPLKCHDLQSDAVDNGCRPLFSALPSSLCSPLSCCWLTGRFTSAHSLWTSGLVVAVACIAVPWLQWGAVLASIGVGQLDGLSAPAPELPAGFDGQNLVDDVRRLRWDWNRPVGKVPLHH